MDRKLLDILVCPASRQPLAMLDKRGLDAINSAIAAGTVRRVDDSPQSDPLREALVTRDHRTVYRIDDGIPVLLVEEGIPAAQVADFPEGMTIEKRNARFEPPAAEVVDVDVARALAEDIGSGDVTAALLPDRPDIAYLLCKQDAVVCGRPWFDACHRALDAAVRIDWRVGEGDRVPAGTVLATLEGRARAIVTAERTSLNFLQTLSGTATITAAYVDALHGTAARILDTRKTIPGLRLAQKYAVRVGGGSNHRIGLYDAVMLKENHVRAAGTITQAIRVARARHPDLPLIVEVESLAQLREALAAGCERVLIDDFDAAMRREAVAIAAGLPRAHRIPLEVSGSVTLQTVRAVAEDGVDCISIGALTKHVQAIDLSLKLGPPPAA